MEANTLAAPRLTKSTHSWDPLAAQRVRPQHFSPTGDHRRTRRVARGTRRQAEDGRFCLRGERRDSDDAYASRVLQRRKKKFRADSHVRGVTSSGDAATRAPNLRLIISLSNVTFRDNTIQTPKLRREPR